MFESKIQLSVNKMAKSVERFFCKFEKTEANLKSTQETSSILMIWNTFSMKIISSVSPLYQIWYQLTMVVCVLELSMSCIGCVVAISVVWNQNVQYILLLKDSPVNCNLFNLPWLWSSFAWSCPSVCGASAWGLSACPKEIISNIFCVFHMLS